MQAYKLLDNFGALLHSVFIQSNFHVYAHHTQHQKWSKTNLSQAKEAILLKTPYSVHQELHFIPGMYNQIKIRLYVRNLL